MKPPSGENPSMVKADESALRGLVASGPSQLGISGALRVRDVHRLTEADVEAAESRVTIKHAAPRPDQPRERS
jgi:hypothetical protein